MNWFVKYAVRNAFSEINDATRYVAVPHGIISVDENGSVMAMDKWTLLAKHEKRGRSVRLALSSATNTIYFGTISRYVDGAYAGSFDACPGQLNAGRLRDL